MYLCKGKPVFPFVHQFLPARYSSYNTLVVNCNIEKLPPPGSEVGTYDSDVIIKLLFILPLPQVSKHKFPFMWHFLTVFGCHCFSLIAGSFLLRNLKWRRRLTQFRRRNLLRKVCPNLLLLKYLLRLQRRFGYQRRR